MDPKQACGSAALFLKIGGICPVRLLCTKRRRGTVAAMRNELRATNGREEQPRASTAPSTTPAQTLVFLTFIELCALVPLSERTLREAIKRGQIPAIRLPGARRLLFDRHAVEAALRRYQRGGIEN